MATFILDIKQVKWKKNLDQGQAISMRAPVPSIGCAPDAKPQLTKLNEEMRHGKDEERLWKCEVPCQETQIRPLRKA